MTDNNLDTPASISFFDRPQVQRETVNGIPLGMEPVSNREVGIAGVYGTWGDSYNNQALPELVEQRLGGTLPDNERLNLAELGFVNRHHVTGLSFDENRKLEVEVGARFLRAAVKACGWLPEEVQAVLLGVSAPLGLDFTEAVARQAGIPDGALKVTIHKACDSSVSGLHLALNPELQENKDLSFNLAELLNGKKILVGGMEGLSRFVESSKDSNALQLFGNAAGVIGLIPGQAMRFIAGKAHQVFDTEGVLQVRMLYPHQHRSQDDLIDVKQTGEHSVRIAGLQYEPQDGANIKMAGPMGMVKLFVRSGVQVVQGVYQAYQEKLKEMGSSGKTIAVAIVHHANYKINRLKEKNLQKEGISLNMPWLLSEFGNVSAASNMIALLRQLPELHPGDHVMIDGFGAGTYYDTFVVELGGAA